MSAKGYDFDLMLQERIDTPDGPKAYRFTQRDYALLSDAGAFDACAKTELIEGVIVAVNARYSKHARFQTGLLRRLADACDALRTDLGAWIEVSISIDDRSMPRPDIVVSRGLPEEGPVEWARVALIVEIADTSLGYDLGEKRRFYAMAGLPEYWVADVNARLLHQLWAPRGEAYSETRDIAFGERVDAATVAGLAVDTANL